MADSETHFHSWLAESPKFIDSEFHLKLGDSAEHKSPEPVWLKDLSSAWLKWNSKNHKFKVRLRPHSRESGANGIQNVMFHIRYCSDRRQPSYGKMFTFRALSGEWQGRVREISSPACPTRTTRCSRNSTDDDKNVVRRKRKENPEFPLHRLHFQTRVDRWVLITALCVVEWNAQHNWLVKLAGLPLQSLTSCFP